jgi:acyl-[acyl carrier protein]--UDP-N-acetylglucosamine O-acyltransferase
VAILGAGGHALVVKEALELMGREVAGMFSKEEPLPGRCDLALGMGRRSLRRNAASEAERAGPLTWVTVIHPSAIISKSAVIHDGAQIMAGAIIQAGAVIGRHAIINTGASVDHGCVVGDFAHVCPGAVLCGDVTVEEEAMVAPGLVVTRGKTVARARGDGAQSKAG